MTGAEINTTVEGGTVQGIVGARSVVIENLTFYGSALPAQPPQQIDDATIPPCPYPGLEYFGPQDSALFFGRDTAIARLTAAVERHPFTALVGASGSGKSSVALAGLAPRLAARSRWGFSYFRVGVVPAQNPFLALARALVPLLAERGITQRAEEEEKLAARLQTGAVNLLTVMGDCRASNPGKRILLIADQFEEVFTLVLDEALRRCFIDTLLAGFPNYADGRSPDICLVITLRADFYGMALRYRPLADALQNRVENLGPMTRDELRKAIEGPAGVVTFESGLIDTLLDDVEYRPGSLPLLQFALQEMWGRLDKRCMTRASYEAIGGVEGALARRAQDIYHSLTEKGADARAVALFRRLFTRLVTLGEGAEDTRRVVSREELGQEAWALAQRLAGEDNRLVVTSAPTPDHETAELVHEALIRNWPELTKWVNGDRAFQLWLRQLKPRLDEWRGQPADEGTLLRGSPLAVAEDWLTRRRDELSDEERVYIEASIALRDAEGRRQAEALAREAAQLAEITAAQARTSRLQRIRTWALAAFAAAVIVGVGAVSLQQLRLIAGQRDLKIQEALNEKQKEQNEKLSRVLKEQIKAIKATEPPRSSNEIEVDFSSTGPNPEAAARDLLAGYGIEIRDVSPAGSKIVLLPHSELYGDAAIVPTANENFLTQTPTENRRASFTLVFSKPLDAFAFRLPNLYGFTEKGGIISPAWTATALDAGGQPLSSHSEALLRGMYFNAGVMLPQTYRLRTPNFKSIAAVRFDSDPHPEGEPYGAAFSAIVIERMVLVPAHDTAAQPSR
jgi:energy-coupling factor transporter ATP-binding protein EcfA2